VRLDDERLRLYLAAIQNGPFGVIKAIPEAKPWQKVEWQEIALISNMIKASRIKGPRCLFFFLAILDPLKIVNSALKQTLRSV
jgi:hypothetical protein